MSQTASPWIDGRFRPHLAEGVRLHWDRHDQRSILLHPEGVLRPSETGAAILTLCDGRRSVDEIAAVLAGMYTREIEGVRRDLIDFLDQLHARVLVRAPVGDEPLDSLTDGAAVDSESLPRSSPNEIPALRTLPRPCRAARAGGGADVRLPAALPVLLEPDAVSAERSGAEHRGVAARVRGSRDRWACSTRSSPAASRSSARTCPS